MLALSVVDNIDATAAAHFINPNSASLIDLNDRSYERFYLLDTDTVALQQGARPELVQLVRNKTTQGILSWIAIYTSLPNKLDMTRPRRGNYCGAGAWFFNSRIEAEIVLPLLRTLLLDLCASIDSMRNPRDWRIATLREKDLGLSDDVFSRVRVQRFKHQPNVGDARICFDLTTDQGQDAIATCIGRIQDDEDYDQYMKILISDDPEVIRDIVDNKRIVVQRFGDRPPSPRRLKPTPQRSAPALLPMPSPTSAARAEVPRRFYAKDEPVNESLDMRRRLGYLEEEFSGLERDRAAKTKQLGKRIYYSLVWNAALSAMLAAVIAYPRLASFAPDDKMPTTIGSPVAPTASRQGPVGPELRPSETRNLGEHSSVEDSNKPAEVRPPKTDDCRGHGSDCVISNNQADIDGLDDASKTIQDAVAKLQVTIDRIPATKQYGRLKEVLKTIKNDAKQVTDIMQALKENSPHPK